MVGVQSGESVLVTIHTPGQQTQTVFFDETGKKTGLSIDLLARQAVLSQPVITGKKLSKRPKMRFIKNLGVVILLSVALAGITGAFTMRVVLTGSMEPTISPGDLIIAINDEFKTPEIGDVVVYTARRFNGEEVAPFAHRIIDGDSVSGWILKGDANREPDIQHPDSTDITGVVVWVIPIVGQFLSTQSLLLGLLLTLLGLLYIYAFERR
jgi:signal peptidase I